MNRVKCYLGCAAVFASLALLAFLKPPATHSQSVQTRQTYIVLYKAQSVPIDAASVIANAGGTLVKSYDKIGVAIATAPSQSFRDSLLADSRVEGASSTAGFAVRLNHSDVEPNNTPVTSLPSLPATDNDTLSGLQWNMAQIHTPEAHAITGGSSAVVVANVQSGVDFTHPDIAPNFDLANSCSCLSGVPDTSPSSYMDNNGSGTHIAGIIAAASNGIGIVGVAPNVKIAAIKAANDDGFVFPEAVICAFMWAASHHVDVANNSYFADPWLFNCRNDAEQRAIWKAEQRAIRYAMNQGVTVVAAIGNQSDDLTHPQVDATSPDFPPGSAQLRDVNNACLVIPVEIPGVIGVSADGNGAQSPNGFLKSFYSNYGLGVADLVAPGGDSNFGLTSAAPNGRVLSTWPASSFTLTCPPARRVVDPSGATYCYQQGTTFASAHVAGVAALIISQLGNLNAQPKMQPARVSALLTGSADAQPCPASVPSGYASFTRPSGDQQTCSGGPSRNSWYGAGQVNAFKAVSP